MGCTLNSSITTFDANLSKTENGSVSPIADTVPPTFLGPVLLGPIPDDLSAAPTLTFTAAIDTQTGVDRYEVQIIKVSDQSTVVSWTNLASGGSLTGLNPLLISGESYLYKVHAIDHAGNVSSALSSTAWVAPVAVTAAFSVNTLSTVQENQTSVSLQVNISATRSADTVIPVSTSGTAMVASDFNLSEAAKITIPAGQLSANVVLNLVNDSDIEPIKFSDVTLTTPASSLVTLGANVTRKVIVLDDDPDSTAMVVSGANHNCYKNLAGAVKCWGRNTWGQLGLGDTNNRGDGPNEMGTNLPVVNLGTGLAAAKLSAGNGSDSTCALFTNGKIKCWGRGDSWAEPGYMGYGHSNHLGDQASDMGDNLPFISLGTGVLARDLETSSFNTCAITTDNKLKCWGVGFHGANGNATDYRVGSNITDMGDNLPYVDLGTGRNVLKVAMGAFHRCAILDNLKVKCWGWNTVGELGTEDTVTRGDDANEMGDNLPYVNLGTGMLAVDIVAATGLYFETGGHHHSCALLMNGKVKCWGANSFGQLGYGSTSSKGGSAGSMGDNLPFVNLGTGRTAKRIFASNFSTCAILDDDSLKCWGSGSSGQLGNNSSSNFADSMATVGDSLPSVFLGASRKAKFVSGSFMEWSDGHRCVMMDDYNVKCFGINTHGELGDGGTNSLGDNANEMQNLNPISIFFDL